MRLKDRYVLSYFVADIVFSVISWALFFLYRKEFIEGNKFQADSNFYLGLFIVPCFWISLYYILGSYRDIFKRHRLRDLGETFLITLIGVTILFFALIINDEYMLKTDYYKAYFGLFIIHFILGLLPKLFITSKIVKSIHNGKISFPTIIIGGNDSAYQVFSEVISLKNSSGYLFKGFVPINKGEDCILNSSLQNLGRYEELHSIIEKHNIEEVIIALESSEHEKINRIITDLSGVNIGIKLIPDTYDILTGSVKMTSIYGALLIEVNREKMPVWQQSVKRIFDVVASLLAITILLPVYIILAILVKTGSNGSIFFSQERIGIYGRPFKILKFRSMVVNAEKEGPQLSSANDSRITRIGRFMRKTRLDEIPQFVNVLKGEMSLVGPRPERQFYIDQIIQKAPHYKHLQKVKPGITSWGQVKYGYAENVDEMVARLKYDILYVENRSLALDVKILIYTVLIVLKGSGK